MNQLIIKQVSNGWTLEYLDVEAFSKSKVIVIENQESESKTTQALLWEIVEYFGLTGNRHDAERISIEIKPGDKYNAK